MAGSINTPDNLKLTFNRLMQRLSADKKDDPALQKSVLQFLKLGGSRLAMARLQPVIHPFPENITIVKPRPLVLSADEDDIDDSDDKDDGDDSDDSDDFED